MTTTHVAFVLDRSGSMANIRKETVSVINEQLAKIKADGLADNVTLVTFSTEVDGPLLIDASTVLTENDYNPSGWTALYDAIGSTVMGMQKLEQSDPDTSFLVIIITDGAENMSKKFSKARTAELIKELQDSKKWTFVYLGTKQDLFSIENDLNIPFGNVEIFARNTAEEIRYTSHILSANTTSYIDERKLGSTHSTNFFNKSKG